MSSSSSSPPSPTYIKASTTTMTNNDDEDMPTSLSYEMLNQYARTCGNTDPVLSTIFKDGGDGGGGSKQKYNNNSDSDDEDDEVLNDSHVKFPITSAGCIAVSHLLKTVISETLIRAGMEAEMAITDDDYTGDDGEDREGRKRRKVVVRQEHVAKVAAEVLMDFT